MYGFSTTCFDVLSVEMDIHTITREVFPSHNLQQTKIQKYVEFDRPGERSPE